MKKTLKNYPDIKQLTHEFHFGMPLENKQVYRAKRKKLSRYLGTAKMVRASITKIKNRQSRHYGKR